MGVSKTICFPILFWWLNSTATAFVTRTTSRVNVPSSIGRSNSNDDRHHRKNRNPSDTSSSSSTFLLQSSLNKELWNASSSTAVASEDDDYVCADSSESQMIENGTEFIDEHSILKARRQYKEGYAEMMMMEKERRKLDGIINGNDDMIIDGPYFPPVSDSIKKEQQGKADKAAASTASYIEDQSAAGLLSPVIDGKVKQQPSSENSNNISTNKLLSSIIHAALHGSQTIRSLGTTEVKARPAARHVIASSLLGSHPNLNIVGAELEPVDDVDSVDTTVEFMRDDLLDEYDDWTTAPSSDSVIDNDDLTPSGLDMNQLEVYVDSLDGTDEEELDAVTCSIGVCYKGRPIMGAIGIPFPSDDESSGTEVVFGMVGRGTGMVISQKKKSSHDDGSVFEKRSLLHLKQYYNGDTINISSSMNSEIARSAVDVADKVFQAKEGQIVQQNVAATGNKFLKVILGQTTLSILDDKTSLCETAAPTAILEAMGGKVSDYFGEPLIYNSKTALVNELGVVASVPGAEREHLQLVSAMRGDKNCLSLLEKYGLKNDDDTTAQCVDIVRDLNGYPLPVQYFADKLNIKNVVSYCCPEKDAFRGLMSNACRVHLFPGGETAFYKRIVFENLDHAKEKLKTAPYKLITDAESYKVVTSFLSSKACREVTEKAGVRIPKLLDVKLEPNDSNPIESKFSFLLEDLAPESGWYLRWLLQDMDECKATLSALAKIHAFFWDGSSFWNDADAAKELEASVWKSASYVQPSRNLNHCKRVAKRWVTERLKCEKELSSLDYWDNLGVRLESIAEECGKMAHPFAEDAAFSESYKKFRTFTHGDPKQANLLFRRSSGESELEVGMIDYQWAGFGLAASDISHFMTSAVHADRLLDGGEDILLRYYYDELQKYLVKFGAYRNADDAVLNFSYDTFMEQYEMGVIDMCRLVVSYTWRRWDPVEKDDEVGCARTMNKNSYSKSVPNTVWLLSRCDEIMKSRGV